MCVCVSVGVYVLREDAESKEWVGRTGSYISAMSTRMCVRKRERDTETETDRQRESERGNRGETSVMSINALPGM